MRYVLAIDQGTTSSRAIVFSADLTPIAGAQKEFTQHYPAAGWVEHDLEEIWAGVLEVSRQAIAKAHLQAKDIAAIGITNQRETTVVWDRATGQAFHNAIVWQDRRTAEACQALKAAGHEPLIAARTGLLLDPYFSATKIGFILDTVPGARARAERGELAFGTIDSFLLWRLTGGKTHATDATNASRTMLCNIHTGQWDDELLALFNIPKSMMPDIRDSSADFGTALPEFFGAAIALRGVAGDQQAATIGQACFEPGMMKSTYGTGCFALLNTGNSAIASSNRLLTTIAYQLDGKRTYALEGSIFIAGAAVQWLRDGLKIITQASDAGPLADESDPGQSVYLVPAFVGLGAPHWDADARGALFGLTRNTGPREIAKAALESVCYQTLDLMDAMRADWVSTNTPRAILRVDGGMTASDWTMQRLADLIDAYVDRPVVTETTAVGAAYLAGLAIGLYPQPKDFMKSWRLEKRFSPHMRAPERTSKIAGWRDAVSRTLTHRN
ncbi:MAG: glycerol kinase GlpK [Pseudomonadota bacterium]